MNPERKKSPEMLPFYQEAYKLQAETVCAMCGGFDGLSCLINCGHLVCKSCLLSSCPVCNKPMQRTNSAKDETFETLLNYIHAICEVDADMNVNLRVESFFTSEATKLKRNWKGESRLHKECRDGKVDEVESLLMTGIDPNIQDFAGWTALHEAVTAQKIDVVKLLLKYGAFPSVPGLHYITPLHTAVQDKNIEMVKLLIEYGAAIICFNMYGKTPLDLCHNCHGLEKAICLTERRPCLYKIYTIPQPKVFLINVDSQNTAKLLQFSAVTISKPNSFLNGGDVTYVVIGTNKKPNIKYLQAAMLQGACVVDVNWIAEFIAEKGVVNPMNFLMDFPGYALRKAVTNMFNRLPKLFNGLRFYCYNSKPQTIGGYEYTVEDFKMLIKLGGGEVLTRRPIRFQERDFYYPYHADKQSNLATTTYYLIYDERKPSILEGNTTAIKNKSGRWLIECINSFSIIA